ncbi:hypothetical protein Sjap_014213 [Stephania japonica]|uniref:RRM domain-containing protein n=1 Tax=Stephania japonica TaxID=461633 RepID=A0AAP0IZE7_9MAGN
MAGIRKAEAVAVDTREIAAEVAVEVAVAVAEGEAEEEAVAVVAAEMGIGRALIQGELSVINVGHLALVGVVGVIREVVVEAVVVVVGIVIGEGEGEGEGEVVDMVEIVVTEVGIMVVEGKAITGVPPPALAPYAGNYPQQPNPYGGNNNYGTDAVPPPASYTGASNSYPPSFGGLPSYGGEAPRDMRGSGGRGGGGGYGGGPRNVGSDYGAPAEPVKIKQCDENCGDSCDNSRIYISNLPPDVTSDELKELFGGIGQVGRIKQKRGYKDQWPYNIKIYTDDSGNSKGDACLSYEDPSAAHSAGGFYNNYDMRGYKINVAMAEKSAPRAAPSYGGGGRGGHGGGGDRRRDNYRDGGGVGADRHQHVCFATACHWFSSVDVPAVGWIKWRICFVYELCRVFYSNVVTTAWPALVGTTISSGRDARVDSIGTSSVAANFFSQSLWSGLASNGLLCHENNMEKNIDDDVKTSEDNISLVIAA